MMRWIRHGAAITALAALAFGCQGDPPGPHRRPNIVLITIDTLRADHCSFYGYERATTPFLDELASRSTVFENTYGTSSWTAPSMASLFTALPPRAHGVIGGVFWNGKVAGQDYLSDDFNTLAEVLARHGYDTFGVSTNAHLTSATGFAQGFAALTELWFKDASVATAEALNFADRLDASSRYFLWVHYFDPHEYHQREPWYGDYRRQRQEGSVRRDTTGPKDVAGFLEDLVDRYDSCINYTDQSVRMLFSRLNLESDALVIVTSDHGEAFFEHGNYAHGKTLFEEEIRVPLIVRVPGQTQGRRVRSRATLLDIYPTILDAATSRAPGKMAGVSLLPAARGEPTADRMIVTELDRGKVADRTLTWGRWKLYQTEKPDRSVRLFDLRDDPAERQDVSADEPDRVEDLQRRWNAWTGTWPRFTAPTKAAPFGEDQLKQLRALGYVTDE
jgi:arylsulfatase A-like enzyme